MPFCTEEAWSWWKSGSIHQAGWPQTAEIAAGGDPAIMAEVSRALAEIRGAKSQAKMSMKTEATRAEVHGSAVALDHLRNAAADLRAVGRITGELVWVEADGPVSVDVDLVPAA